MVVFSLPCSLTRRFSRFGTFRKSHEAASCVARKRTVDFRNYTYYSNEYTVHGGHKSIDNAHMCAELFNAVVLRCAGAAEAAGAGGRGVDKTRPQKEGP